MKLVVQPKSETPLYVQLYDQIVSQIVCGDLVHNQCLPSIRFVAREMEISVIPVKAAYDLLEKEGYIYTLPGKGCFVAETKPPQKRLDLARAKLQETLDFCKKLGLSPKEFLQIAQDYVDSSDK